MVGSSTSRACVFVRFTVWDVVAELLTLEAASWFREHFLYCYVLPLDEDTILDDVIGRFSVEDPYGDVSYLLIF